MAVYTCGSEQNSMIFAESISEDESHSHRLYEILFEGEACGQSVCIAQTVHGRAFIRNGRLQSMEADEWIYHEALVHPALIYHHSPRRVLCVGGSTGGILREMLKHKSVESATFVEANSDLIALTRRHLPHLDCGAFDDPRTEIIEESAERWLEREGENYDCIVIDPPEPSEERAGAVDYLNARLIAGLRERLTPGGIMSFAGGAANTQADSPLPIAVRIAREFFPNVDVSMAEVPSLGTAWGFVSCSVGGGPASQSREEIDARIAERNLKPLRYYDGITHQRIFSIPVYLRHWISAGGQRETGRPKN